VCVEVSNSVQIKYLKIYNYSRTIFGTKLVFTKKKNTFHYGGSRVVEPWKYSSYIIF
jgi:hypothetical protein